MSPSPLLLALVISPGAGSATTDDPLRANTAAVAMIDNLRFEFQNTVSPKIEGRIGSTTRGECWRAAGATRIRLINPGRTIDLLSVAGRTTAVYTSNPGGGATPTAAISRSIRTCVSSTPASDLLLAHGPDELPLLDYLTSSGSTYKVSHPTSEHAVVELTTNDLYKVALTVRLSAAHNWLADRLEAVRRLDDARVEHTIHTITQFQQPDRGIWVPTARRAESEVNGKVTVVHEMTVNKLTRITGLPADKATVRFPPDIWVRDSIRGTYIKTDGAGNLTKVERLDTSTAQPAGPDGPSGSSGPTPLDADERGGRWWVWLIGGSLALGVGAVGYRLVRRDSP